MPRSFPNPLRDLHAQAEAEFQPYGDVEIVSTFGEPQAEYAALHKGCGMMDLPQRGVLELTGQDRLSFLNNMVSNDTWDKQTKAPMPVGRWVYAFFLNAKGRIVTDMNVIEVGDRTLLEMDARMVEPLREALGRYLFAEKVTMTSRVGALHEIGLYGPGAMAVVRELAHLPESFGAPQTCASVRVLGHDAVVWRDDPTGREGVNLIMPVTVAREIWMHLLTTFGQQDAAGKRRLRPVGWAAFNAARIEAGRPIFDIDFPARLRIVPGARFNPADADAPAAEASAGVLPAETGQEARALSYTKCYIGQEIVARMHARGQVARRIVGVRMEGDALPIAGAPVYDDASNTVGGVTSSTLSPVLSNAALCLAFVKKSHTTAGSIVHVPAEGEMRKGTVTRLPFL